MFRELYSSEYSSVMQTEALKLWAELEGESGQKLLRKHGTLNYGEPDRGETVQESRPPSSAHCIAGSPSWLYSLLMSDGNRERSAAQKEGGLFAWRCQSVPDGMGHPV